MQVPPPADLRIIQKIYTVRCPTFIPSKNGQAIQIQGARTSLSDQFCSNLWVAVEDGDVVGFWFYSQTA